MRVLMVAIAAAFLGCATTTSESRRTLFTTTPTVPQGFAGNYGMNLAGRAMVAKPKEDASNSTAYAFLQFEGGGMVRFEDNRTSLGVRVNIAPSFTGVAQPADRLRVPSNIVAGEAEIQAAHDVPLHRYFGLTAAVSAGMVFSHLLIEQSFFTHVELSPHFAGGLGFYGTVAGFRPYIALSVTTQVLNPSTSIVTCTAGFCDDKTPLRIGAVLMASTGARYSWGTGAVEIGVVIPLTQDGQRLPVMLAFSAYLGDFLVKPPAKVLPPPPVMTPPPPPPADVTDLPPEAPPI